MESVIVRYALSISKHSSRGTTPATVMWLRSSMETGPIPACEGHCRELGVISGTNRTILDIVSVWHPFSSLIIATYQLPVSCRCKIGGHLFDHVA